MLVIVTLMSCDKCKEIEPPLPVLDYSSGIWMINEGAFNSNNASIDVRASNGEILRDVFQSVNGFPLGDVLQRVVVENGLAYAVLNNSNKVVVFDAKTFGWVRDIDGLDYPRDVAIVNGKIFIAQGAMQGKVSQYSSTGQWISDVEVGNGPERLLYAHNRLWVLNSGGWLTDNRVQTIDVTSMTVDNTWTVGDRPVDIEYEPTEGAIFVLASGETLYDANWNVTGHTDAMLSKFTGLNAPLTIPVSAVGDHPRSMALTAVDHNILLVNQHVSAFQSNLNPLCNECIPGSFYSIDADDDGNVFVTSMPDFTTASSVSQFDASDYSFVREFEGGVGTSAVFRP